MNTKLLRVFDHFQCSRVSPNRSIVNYANEVSEKQKFGTLDNVGHEIFKFKTPNLFGNILYLKANN